MVSVRFHSLDRDRPQLGIEVELVPDRPERLAAAHPGQDGKLQCTIGNAGTLTQRRHEFRYRAIGQRLVMLDLRDFALARQQIREVSAPSGWIFAAPVAGAAREVQDALDPAAQSRRGLRLLCPDWSQYRDDRRGIDPRDRQVPEGRVGISRQAARPLVGMPRAFPGGLMVGDMRFSARRKRDRPRRAPGPLRAARLDRIDALFGELAVLGRALAGLREAEVGGRAKAHRMRDAAEHVAQYPRLRVAVADPQIEPATVAVEPWFCGALDLEGR